MLFLGPDGVQQAAKIIVSGGIAAFPTETVYGLGADAFNVRALARIFEAKNRPRFDPLIIHLAGYETLSLPARLSALSRDRRALVEKLAEAFWPGPLTMVLPKQPALPGLATAGLSTAAVRVPAHPVALELIRLSGGALAAPSANPFGRLSPTRAEHVAEGLGEKIDCIIDGGPCRIGVESTVLDLCSDDIRILRPGGAGLEEIEQVTGRNVIVNSRDFADQTKAESSGLHSPGMLKSHYAPSVPLDLYTNAEMINAPFTRGEALLFFSGTTRAAWEQGRPALRSGAKPDGLAVLTLSETGCVLEAAANLFDALYRLDALRPSRIRAEILPQEGLGAAVNDRLYRAAG